MGCTDHNITWRTHLIRLSFFCATFYFNATAAASPWATENGKFLIITRANYFKATSKPTPSDPIDTAQFQRFDSDTYIEFGATDSITLGGKVAYGTSWSTQANSTNTASGFSELEIFGQYQFHRNHQDAASIRFTASRPSSLSSGTRSALQSDGTDFDATFSYGRNLQTGSVKIFTAAEAGYRKRLGSGADQIRFQTTFGIEPNQKLMFLIDAYATLSVGNQDASGADYDVIKIQPSALWMITKRWGLQAGLTEEIYGRNLPLGRTYFVSLWSRF